MAARSTWAGAVDFCGFPVHLRAYSLVKSASAESFKTLCPCHGQPIVMPKRCAVDDTVVDTALCGKGVKDGKLVKALSKEALESIEKAEATDVLPIDGLPSRDSVPLHLATHQYRLVPNEKVPGSAGPANIIWNGLKATGRVLVVDGFVPRAGSRPMLLAITADVYGLTGVGLPYASSFNDVPEHQFADDATAAQAFEGFAKQNAIPLDDFALATHVDTYGEKRAEVIAAALAGDPIPTTGTKAPDKAVPDLMAAMAAAMENAKPSAKPKAKRAPKKKVSA